MITVKFNEAVDVSSVIDTSNWRLNLGLKVGSVFGIKRVTGSYKDTLRFFFTVTDAEGDSLSYRYRYRFDSVWVDADVEYVGSVGDTVVVVWHFR